MLNINRHASFSTRFVILIIKTTSNCHILNSVRFSHKKHKDKLASILKDLVVMNEQGGQQHRFQKKEKETLRHVKYREKKGSLKVSSTLDIHVIGCGGPGAAKSVLMNTSFNRYLFNCGEGVQRMVTESKLKMAKLENIFITHKSWENIGGVSGMCLSLEDLGVPRITLHGPPGVETVTRNSMSLVDFNKVEIDRQKAYTRSFSDSDVVVDYVPLLPERLEKEYNPVDDSSSQETCIKSHSSQNTNEDIKSEKLKGGENVALKNTKTDEPPSKKKRYTHLTPLTDPEVTVAYIIRPHPKPRSVNLEKCVDLGIQRGPMIGQLVDGFDVTLDDGTVIHPDQVLNEEEVAKPIVVVECPSEDHLYSLLRSKQMSECQTGEKPAELVVHMTQYDIVQNPKYQSFIERFPDSTNHIFLHEKTGGVLFGKHLQINTWLNMLHPEMFPQVTLFDQTVENSEKENMVVAKPFVKYCYRPKKGFDWEDCIKESPEEQFREEINQNKEAMESIKDFHEMLSLKTSDSGNKYPEIVVLGTGSAYPSLARNVSSNIINIDDETSLVLDCGEDTIGQMYRMFGDAKTDEMLLKIKVIYLSHLHPDHHLGMIGIINARMRALARAGKGDDPVLVCAPIQIKKWLHANQEHFGALDKKLKLVPLQFLMKEPYTVERLATNQHLIDEVCNALNCVEFRPVSVIHNMHACGISIVHKSGWKIVYSGDTRPCQALVNVGKGCDLLIHEATLEDGLEDDARKKKHSTVSQAVDIGVQMGAKFTLLTHFSQRYPRLPNFKKEYDHPIGIAFDCMKVKLSEINILKDLLKPLHVIFTEDILSMKNRTYKKFSRKQTAEKILKAQEENPQEMFAWKQGESLSSTDQMEANFFHRKPILH